MIPSDSSPQTPAYSQQAHLGPNLGNDASGNQVETSILDILRKRPSDYTEDDIMRLREMLQCVHRHSAPRHL